MKREFSFKTKGVTSDGDILISAQEAQELLYDLHTEMESLRTQSQWISVEDRLPGHGVRVLITDGENIGHARTQDRLHGYSWLVVSSNTHVPMSDVTHWMPLPLPPKAGES